MNLNAYNFVRRWIKAANCNALVARDQRTEEFLEGLKEGREVIVRVDKPRNPQHHRLLFAMLKFVLDNTEERWPHTEALLYDLKLATGLTERRVNAITGEPYVIARSIAFESMAQPEFEQWFDLVMALIAVNAVQIPKEEAWRHVLEMAGETRRAA